MRRRSRLWLLAAVFLAAVPVMFGLIRAVSTSGDVRYLWLAGAASLGSMAVMLLGRGPAGSAPVSLGRAFGAVAAGTLCAAATAVLMGAKAGLGVAIVALAFGLCTGTSAVSRRSRDSRGRVDRELQPTRRPPGSPHLHEGTLFIYVYFGLAPGIALLLAWRSVRRVFREPRLKWRILVAGTTALALWALGSFVMFYAAFGVAWSLGHTRPLPAGFFPEGWPIYGCLAAYAAAGASLAWALGRLPRRKTAV